MSKSMEEIRHDVVERTTALLRIHKFLSTAGTHIGYAVTDAEEQIFPGEAQVRQILNEIKASLTVNNLVLWRIETTLSQNLEQLGSLIAKDVIAPTARDSATPVVFITGNSYMPPIRDLEDVEAIWQADTNGEYFAILVEAIESRLAMEMVYLAQPEYDNALYVVDLKRWQFKELSQDECNDIDDINDEWEPLEVIS